jgi:DNA-3-methyladenine glycosylase
VRETAEGIASGRIVETEANVVGDAAGTPTAGLGRVIGRSFSSAGNAYVYLVYGSAYMLNISSEIAGIGAGVLIRALEPRDGVPIMQRNRQIERLRDLARRPGRLTAALRVDSRFGGRDLRREGPLWLGRCHHEPGEIGQSIRIGLAGCEQAPAILSSGQSVRRAVQDCLRNKRPYHGRSPPLLIGWPRFEAPFIPLAIPSHCMNSSVSASLTA